MKRFILAAAVAVALGLGSAATASAQYVIPYGGITPSGGVVSGDSIYNLGNYQSYSTYVSPFGTVRQQAYTTNALGSTYGVVQGYNPYTGLGYTRGFYNPGYAFPGLVTYPNTFYPATRIAPVYPIGGLGYGYGLGRRF
jgi:hypothetical protein